MWICPLLSRGFFGEDPQKLLDQRVKGRRKPHKLLPGMTLYEHEIL